MTDGYGKENSVVYWKARHRLLMERYNLAREVLIEIANMNENAGEIGEGKLRNIIEKAREVVMTKYEVTMKVTKSFFKPITVYARDEADAEEKAADIVFGWDDVDDAEMVDIEEVDA